LVSKYWSLFKMAATHLWILKMIKKIT
jgi:hypothetical protein